MKNHAYAVLTEKQRWKFDNKSRYIAVKWVYDNVGLWDSKYNEEDHENDRRTNWTQHVEFMIVLTKMRLI